MLASNLSLVLYFSILYIIGLSIIYFSKQRMDNIENRIYSWLLALNILGLVLQLLCEFVSVHYDIMPIFMSNFIYKLFVIYFIAWVNTMLDYLLAVAFKNGRKLVWLNIAITIITCITTLFLPFELYRDTTQNVYYTFGPAISASFIISAILMTLMFIIMLIKYKEVRKKKIMPILIFLALGTVAAFIQHFNPSLVIITAVESFICFLMYFTIENPDLKVIEQLNEAKDQADKANQAKSEFLSSMSHEIRTPLNAIVGFSQGLLERQLNEEEKQEVNDIISASNTLLEIVDGILDISKIEANKLEIIENSYNFQELFNELVSLSKARLGDKPLEFKYYCDPSIPATLYGDATRLKQIIINLLTNAIKYTKEGSFDFKVNSLIQKDTCRLIISVEDTGIGIKEENINKLFNKFERFDEKNTTIEGTGLGLAITKKLVELMHGKIIVQSKYGEGSKFTVILDQKIIATKKEPKEVISQEIKDFSNKNILIVDDNELNLKVATRLLQKYHVQTTTVTSGFECLDLIAQNESYDLIFLDDMMPKLSGVDTLHRLKENEKFNIPVVCLTANAISGMKEKYLADGFNDYLAKPIEKEELNRVLNKFLS